MYQAVVQICAICSFFSTTIASIVYVIIKYINQSL
jgi:hypothetical protein